MSRVYLIASDKPLPLCNKREERSATVGKFTVTTLCGFHVTEHRYYRDAVEAMELTMKPYQYEVQLECNARDLAALCDYLVQQLPSGEKVELWSLWVGDDPQSLVRCQGHLAEFGMDTLEQFLTAPQICMTITI